MNDSGASLDPLQIQSKGMKSVIKFIRPWPALLKIAKYGFQNFCEALCCFIYVAVVYTGFESKNSQN